MTENLPNIHFNQALRDVIDNATPDATRCQYVEPLRLSGKRIVQRNNLFLFEHLRPAGPFSLLPGNDETGTECFINRIPFQVDDLHHCLDLASLVFADVDASWKHAGIPNSGRIRQIMSYHDDRANTGQIYGTYRFHLVRSGQSWLADNLDEYQEVILTCDSDPC